MNGLKKLNVSRVRLRVEYSPDLLGVMMPIWIVEYKEGLDPRWHWRCSDFVEDNAKRAYESLRNSAKAAKHNIKHACVLLDERI